jgi:hypothetical protein
MMDRPLLVFAVGLGLLWLAGRMGTWFREHRSRLEEGERSDLNVILTAALTLFGLIVGFTLSMAVTRYDQRKLDEAVEANGIGTAYTRADLLPAAGASRLRELLRCYLGQRVEFYTTRRADELRRINAATEETQTALWSAVREQSGGLPPPIAALLLSGMNDVFNAQAYTQAAWWNRIPMPAWVLLLSIGMCCNGLLGYASRRPEGHWRVFLLLPLIASVSFFLIADIDSPRGGIIRVHPQNLESVMRSLPAE